MSEATDPTPTPLSQQAAKPSDPPSWHAPVADLNNRVMALEKTQATIITGQAEFRAEVAAGFKTVNDKTDLQNVVLGEIRGALKNPLFRQLALVLFGALYIRYRPWLHAHGIKIPFLETDQ